MPASMVLLLKFGERVNQNARGENSVRLGSLRYMATPRKKDQQKSA